MKITCVKSDLPVSRKFYDEMCRRIKTVIDDMNLESFDMSYKEVIEHIDNYLMFESVPAINVHMSVEVNIIFYIMLPEIDKALERSRRAREAGARRRAANALKKAECEAVKQENTQESEAAQTPLVEALDLQGDAGAQIEPEARGAQENSVGEQSDAAVGDEMKQPLPKASHRRSRYFRRKNKKHKR